MTEVATIGGHIHAMVGHQSPLSDGDKFDCNLLYDTVCWTIGKRYPTLEPASTLRCLPMPENPFASDDRVVAAAKRLLKEEEHAIGRDKVRAMEEATLFGDLAVDCLERIGYAQRLVEQMELASEKQYRRCVERVAHLDRVGYAQRLEEMERACKKEYQHCTECARSAENILQGHRLAKQDVARATEKWRTMIDCGDSILPTLARA